VTLAVPRSLILCVIAALAVAACATPAPGTLAATDPGAVAHCRDLMYIARVPRGPPNWYLYDQCMQEAAAKKR
jgi:hypothetical protein